MAFPLSTPCPNMHSDHTFTPTLGLPKVVVFVFVAVVVFVTVYQRSLPRLPP